MKAFIFTLVVCCLVRIVEPAPDVYAGSTFFNGFQFYHAADPTHGFVKYISRPEAMQHGLINVKNGVVYIYSDSQNVSSSAGRLSVRLTSRKAYTGGLFVFDV